MQLFFARLAVLGMGVLALQLVGCSSPDKAQAASAEQCNELVDDGPTVKLGLLDKPAPTPGGGALTDGVYELRGATLYDIPVGTTIDTELSAVFEIGGGVIQQVGHIDGVEKRYTSTYTTSGTMLSTTDTCPASDSGTYGFRATPVDFVVYLSENGRTMEQRFTKR